MMNEQLKKEQMKQKIDQLSEALTQIFTEDSEEMKLPVSTKKRKGNPDFRIEDAEEDALPLVSVIMPVYNAEKLPACRFEPEVSEPGSHLHQ